jgi:hypothetical protein
VFGVKYPQLMAPTKRTPALGRINQYRPKARSDAQPYPQQHSQQSSDEDTPFPPNREPSIENNNSNMPVDIDVPDAGESRPHNVNIDGNSTGHQGPLQLYRVPINKPVITFSKELTVRTWGLGWQWLTTKSDADTSSPSMRMLQTSLCMFPTNDLHMYMTETI